MSVRVNDSIMAEFRRYLGQFGVESVKIDVASFVYEIDGFRRG